MSSISGVAGSAYSNSLSQIASGIKLQSAADGASEMAIVEKQNAQINGLNMGERNAQDAKSLLNVADGAMDGIAEASNTAVLSDEDRQMIQDEIDQLKQGISDIANNTEFNRKKLLDGSYNDGYIATGPNGSGLMLNIGDSTLQALGIADFDVTGNFSVDTIDNALSKVSSNRSVIGAQSNAIDFTIAYNAIASINLTSASSRLEDTDIAKAASEMDKEKLLQSYQIMLQRKQQEQEKQRFSLFYA